MCGFAQFIAIHIMSGEATRINAPTSSEAETTAIDNFDGYLEYYVSGRACIAAMSGCNCAMVQSMASAASVAGIFEMCIGGVNFYH